MAGMGVRMPISVAQLYQLSRCMLTGKMDSGCVTQALAVRNKLGTGSLVTMMYMFGTVYVLFLHVVM